MMVVAVITGGDDHDLGTGKEVEIGVSVFRGKVKECRWRR